MRNLPQIFFISLKLLNQRDEVLGAGVGYVFGVSTLSYNDRQSAFFKFQALNGQNFVTKEFVIPYYDTSRNLTQDAETLLDMVRFVSNDDTGITQRKVLKATLIRQI